MKKWKIIVLIFVLIIVLYLFMIIAVVPSLVVVEENKAIRGAHRGDWGMYQENTLEALKSAVEKEEFRFIEFDVQYTKDKIMVLHHDQSLFRIQKKMAKIPDLNYSELLNISDYHIPTYQEAMKIVSGKKPLNVEIKSQGNFSDDKNLADFLIADFEKRGIRNTTILSSISKEVLAYVRDNYNNESFSDNEIVHTDPYFDFKPYIQTGIIYYVDSSTFVPIQQIFISDLVGTARELKVTYLLLHGSNIYNYPEISNLMPQGMKVIFWYFDNRMYIIERETTSRFEIFSSEKISTTKGGMPSEEKVNEGIVSIDGEEKLVIQRKENLIDFLFKPRV